MCQPHWKKKETLVERRGIDVFIAIDVSNSMLAKDIAPSRLDKAKLELSGLVDRLKGDRVGIIAFAGDAYIQCPLTLDRGAVKLFLSTVNPGLVTTQGTVLTNAIKVALLAFTDKTPGHKAIILITDGEDHEGDAVKAARRAKDQGVRIFTIGVGTPEGRTLPDESGQGIKKDREGRRVLSLLKDVARESGGAYQRSSRGDLAIDELVRGIRGMTPGGARSEWSFEYEENYQWLVLAAIFFLFAETVLSERRRTELR
jgi:Ca-activated chloride channel family protein